MKKSVNINPVISFMEKLNNSYDFKSETIIPFFYNTVKRKVSTSIPIVSIRYLLIRIEKDIEEIDRIIFMRKSTKDSLKKTLIYKNFVNILKEFKSACIRRGLSKEITSPIIITPDLENTLAVRTFMELVLSDILREIHDKGNNVVRRNSSKILSAIDTGKTEEVYDEEEYDIKLLNLCVDTMASYLKTINKEG